MIKQLKHIKLPYYDGNNFWSICPYNGSLLKTESKNYLHPASIPKKVSKVLKYCNNPYLCNTYNEIEVKHDNYKLFAELNRMHNRLLKISNKRFYLTRIYSSLRKLMFENTNEAIAYINRLPPQVEYKHQLCLQRAFLAAKISKSFTKDGVIIIGAFLPTGDMHAWIIEDGKQPDIDDRGWINYRPLLAIYY